MASFADYLTQRLTPATTGVFPAGQTLAPSGGVQLADILGGLAAASRQAIPAPAPTPQPSLTMTPQAGAAVPTEQGPDPLAALTQILGAMPQGQAGSSPLAGLSTPMDPRVGAGINMNGDVLQQNPQAPAGTGTSPFSAATDWLANLFGTAPQESPAANAAAAAAMGTLQGGAPSPLQPQAEPATPAQSAALPPAVGAAVPTTGKPAATTAKPAGAPTPASSGKTAPEISPIAAPAYKAISAAKDIPAEDKSNLSQVFQNEDLYKTMISIGAALSRGEDYGSAMEKGAATFLGAQAARAQQAKDAEALRYQRAQDSFNNDIKVANLKRGLDKDAVDAELSRAKVAAEKAKIPLTQQQVLLVQQRIAESKANQAKAGKEMSGLLPKDYAKMKLDVIKDMSANGEEPVAGMSLDDAAQVRVNLALPDSMRQYAPIPSAVRKEVQGIAAKPALTPEDKTRLEQYRLLYGSVF